MKIKTSSSTASLLLGNSKSAAVLNTDSNVSLRATPMANEKENITNIPISKTTSKVLLISSQSSTSVKLVDKAKLRAKHQRQSCVLTSQTVANQKNLVRDGKLRQKPMKQEAITRINNEFQLFNVLNEKIQEGNVEEIALIIKTHY